MPDGNLFSISKEGQLRDGVDVPVSSDPSLQKYKFSESLSLDCVGITSSKFYIFKRLSFDLLFAVAEDSSKKTLSVALVSRKLELLHMINLKVAAGHVGKRKINLIREDSWRGHPLIISAREIFEIDLFLIAKNQIMHLQTISSYPKHTEIPVEEPFRCLEKVDGHWYIGAGYFSCVLVDPAASKFEDYPLLRRIRFTAF